MDPGRLRQPGFRARLGRRPAMLLAVMAAGGMLAVPAGAGPRESVPGQIAFYGDIGNVVNSAYRKNPLLVRPTTLLLTEDGSVALIHLKWRGWGTSVARATGIWSSSNCTPSCTTGKLTQIPARLTLSSPGLVGGAPGVSLLPGFPTAPGAGHRRSRVHPSAGNALRVCGGSSSMRRGQSLLYRPVANTEWTGRPLSVVQAKESLAIARIDFRLAGWQRYRSMGKSSRPHCLQSSGRAARHIPVATCGSTCLTARGCEWTPAEHHGREKNRP